MDVVFDKSFSRGLDKISDKNLKQKIGNIISEIEIAEHIGQIHNLKKIAGFKSYYRIRIGDYRLGLELEKNSILRFILIAHRKDIYKLFP
jgi:mRNA interferase RelE/StbE